ncbi:hypothetical protein ACRALDRAFT_1093813 [Sodiomyces alcalophilus JCM 7366]|uniref:uncharacterized protein n=1 Tax=Sodiomyces alcalophilus JCM 7366 TaxID=591952 RepID=UPI0039B56165
MSSIYVVNLHHQPTSSIYVVNLRRQSTSSIYVINLRGVDGVDKEGKRRYYCRIGWPKAGPERVIPGPKVGVDLPQE